LGLLYEIYHDALSHVCQSVYSNVTKNGLTTVISVALYDNIGNMIKGRLEVISMIMIVRLLL